MQIRVRILLLFILNTTFSFSQNLLENGDFEANGGSLNHWTYTSNTQLMADGPTHYAQISGENGVLYQRVASITPGSAYTCTIDFAYLKAKQTTGFGFAIEKGSALVLPAFTTGASNLKTFCESNTGQWTTLTDGLEESNVSKTFSFLAPAGATAVYICLGTKGVISVLRVNAIQLRQESSTQLSFEVKSKLKGTPLPEATITLEGLGTALQTDASGKASLNLPPNTYTFSVARDWFATYTGTVTVGTTPQTVSVSMDSIRKVKEVQTRISKYNDNQTPYPLYGHLWTGGLTYSNDLITRLTSSLDYIIGGDGVADNATVSDKLHAADARFQVIQYNGGWSTKRASIENRKFSLQYYRCGLLATDIDATTTSFVIQTPPDNRGKGLIASETGNFTTWIRIENELMKLVGVSSTSTYPITVTVERGLDGSTPTTHKANTAVTTPLYTTAPVPGGNNANLAYFANIWNVRGNTIKTDVLRYAQQYNQDGIWIDILVGWLDAKSMTGGTYTLWDHTKETELTSTAIIAYTKEAVQAIYNGFYARMGYFPQVYGNNVLYSATLTPADRGYMMVQTPEHPNVLAGFCHENSWGHMSDSPDNIDNDGNPIPTNDKAIILGEKGHYLEWYIGNTWLNNCKAIALLAQKNLPNQPMTINAGFKNQWFAEDLTDQIRYDFHKYAYASYLMCVDVKADSSVSCRMGISPMVKKGTNVTVKIDTFFYYRVGIPLETKAWNQFDQYRVGTHNLFARRFSNGLILVNPYKEDMTAAVTLASITGGSTQYTDPENNNQSVTSIQLKSRESMILLKKDQVTALDPATVATSMAVFPIPAKQQVHIQLASGNFLTGQTQQKEVTLYQSGRLVFKKKLSFTNGYTQLDTSTLPAGLYILKIEGVHGRKKVVLVP